MFILDTINNDNPQSISSQFERYYDYLRSNQAKLPKAAYEYATAPWHYNFGLEDPRCPHDAWVESILIREQEVGLPPQRRQRELWIDVRLLNAQQSGYIEISYAYVASLSLEVPNVVDTELPASSNRGYHDWLIDEIRLSDHGLIVHEVDFRLGAHWLIECKELSYNWQPIDK